jgi:hypothetical protein
MGPTASCWLTVGLLPPQTLVCLTLFTAANVLKTLLAKVMSSTFHKRAYFDKMQDALQKASLGFRV